MRTKTTYLKRDQKRVNKKQAYLRRIDSSERQRSAPPEIETTETAVVTAADPAPVVETRPADLAPRNRSTRKSGNALYKWVIVMLSIIIVALLAGFYFYTWVPEPAPKVIQEMASAAPMTAKRAHLAASAVAEQWASDAQLLKLSASWEAGQSFQEGVGNWSAVYYSPSGSETALVSVVDGEARLIKIQGLEERPSVREADAWRIDSPVVIEQLRANGGEDFLRSYPVASLVLLLDLEGDATWKARLIHQESRRILMARINIDDGQLIGIQQSG